MIVRGKYPDYLMHYGRSINDGAPGVGTGNWRRGGSMSPHATEVVYSVNEYMARERYKQNKPKSIIRRAVHDIKDRINEAKKSSARKYTDKLVANINEGFKLSLKHGLPNKEVVEATKELDKYKNLKDEDRKLDMALEYADWHAGDVRGYDKAMKDHPDIMNKILKASPKEQVEIMNDALSEDKKDAIDIYMCLQTVIQAKSIDWYNSRPKNKEQAKNINDDYRAFEIESDPKRDPKEREEYRQKEFEANQRMIAQTLKDIGWEVTPENIRLMDPILMWD